MNSDDKISDNELENDIRLIAEEGVALLMRAAFCAGKRNIEQSRAFNLFLEQSIPRIVAQTIRFKR